MKGKINMGMFKTLVFIAGLGIPLFSQGFIGDQLENGSVNYADRTITAIGIGFIPENAINAGQARRSALRISKQDALRNLIEIVNGVVVTSETTVSGAMFDDEIKTKVKGVIRGAERVGDPKYLSDTSVEVTYQVKMSGISEVLIPPAIISAVLENTGTEKKSVINKTIDPSSGDITGIIIDTRGLKVRPALAPKVIDKDGGIVYGPGDYSREYAVTQGVVGYSKTIESAKKDSRVKGNPLVIKATGVSGQNSTDVIIGNDDIKRVGSANTSYGVLNDCRVIILLD
ncbi:uncharacterized protein METZ01_LOCUS175311 [marine metagenome]|uniref:Flagellar assembly protein T N-terminal domain-containing protein n=1 Tax=marine metagenome TaxID=408172 RepID=A0A382CAT3_9ZZZZ